jgi:alpha-galactosidase
MTSLARLFVALVVCLQLGFVNFVHGQAPGDTSSLIRTPPAPKTPRINGARIFGSHPGHPFLYHLPVTGDRPITYSAEGLPDGLVLDSATGNITGSVANEGRFSVKFTAKNLLGADSKAITLVIGRTICLTPPMGWNSWNCFGGNIDETKIRGAADAMVKTGLIDHGWTYINMDDRWEGDRDAEGKIQSSKGIPDMKGLADYIHGLGLKIGLYSSPGAMTCAGAAASFGHEDQDAQTYADWGMDYLKYDWCSYQENIITERAEKFAIALPGSADEILKLGWRQRDLEAKWAGHPPYKWGTLTQEERDAISKEDHEIGGKLEELYHQASGEIQGEINTGSDKEPYQKMRAALDKVNRDIVYSFCQYGIGGVWSWGLEVGGNTWRTTGDIGPNWPSVEDHGFNQNGLEKWASPGHWNDPDMLEIGNGALTPDENYTHMTLWCMLASPLLIGCDMAKMSSFTVSLFSNDEVLAVSQDSSGKQGHRIKQDGKTEVWVKPLDDGTLAVAFFNRGEAAADVAVSWSDLGLQGKQPMRDLWRQKDMDTAEGQYSVKVAKHGAELLRIGVRRVIVSTTERRVRLIQY